MLAPDGIRSNYVTPARVPQDPPAPSTPPQQGPQAAPAQPPDRDVQKAADDVMRAGDRSFMKDDYEKRMDVFAQEMAQGNQAFRTQLVTEILKRDEGAFDSWMHGDRLQSRLDSGHINANERNAVIDGFKGAIAEKRVEPGRVDADFVRDTHDSGLIATYMKAQNVGDREGFNRALKAFSGVDAKAMDSFVTDPANKKTMVDFELSIQKNQNWYESQTSDFKQPSSFGWWSTTVEAPITFSKEQLGAMRDSFKNRDGLMTNGELLLAYPDRMERNEQVTRQYKELSDGMGDIVGRDNANWANFAVAASDEIGRNLQGTEGIAIAESLNADPKYWLSKGNSVLVSDIGPGFQYFVETFKDGKNRDMSFDKFWQGLEQKWSGREISYIDGKAPDGGPGDKENDMKNAFKAYYETMKLNDQEKKTSQLSPAGIERIAELGEQRSKLMLYANTLVGLQEQEQVQKDIGDGLTVYGITNFAGMAGKNIDFHLPDGSKDGRRLDTDVNLENTPIRVDLKGGSFTTVDGKTIDLDTAVRDRLNSIDSKDSEDESDPAHSGTKHWESYSQRMGYIYHLFADYQRDPNLFSDPRQLYGSRAKEFENDPTITRPPAPRPPSF